MGRMMRAANDVTNRNAETELAKLRRRSSLPYRKRLSAEGAECEGGLRGVNATEGIIRTRSSRRTGLRSARHSGQLDIRGRERQEPRQQRANGGVCVTTADVDVDVEANADANADIDSRRESASSLRRHMSIAAMSPAASQGLDLGMAIGAIAKLSIGESRRRCRDQKRLRRAVERLRKELLALRFDLQAVRVAEDNDGFVGEDEEAAPSEHVSNL